MTATITHLLSDEAIHKILEIIAKERDLDEDAELVIGFV